MTGVSLLDAPADGAISAAGAWLVNSALGSTAAIVATLAVAAMGMMMLAGRIDLRRGTAVIVGCVLILSARPLVAAIGGRHSMSLPRSAVSQEQQLDAAPPVAPVYDPYAGASLR